MLDAFRAILGGAHERDRMTSGSGEAFQPAAALYRRTSSIPSDFRFFAMAVTSFAQTFLAPTLRAWRMQIR